MPPTWCQQVLFENTLALISNFWVISEFKFSVFEVFRISVMYDWDYAEAEAISQNSACE